MSRRCQVSGAEPGYGNAVSHSHQRTRRRWQPNLQGHRYWVPSQRRYVTLILTANAMRTIDRQGIGRVLARGRRTAGR